MVTENKTALPNIDFEGKVVKPNSGYYRCPYKCHSSGYPAPKWKTEKGFRSHMEKCPNSPSKYMASIYKLKEATNKMEELKKTCLDSGLIPYKIGDKICYHSYHITKPTHEKRWNRMVRVRYEEERRYYAKEEVIVSIDFEIPRYAITESSVEDTIKNYMVINRKVRLSDICGTMSEANEIARQNQLSYNKSCDDAAMCR